MIVLNINLQGSKFAELLLFLSCDKTDGQEMIQASLSHNLLAFKTFCQFISEGE